MSYFYNPVKIYFGGNALENLSALIVQHVEKNKNVLLITRGRDFKVSLEHERILEQLKNNKIHEIEFTNSNPDVTDVYNVICKNETFGYDIVIGVGGGSVLDISKAMAAFRGLPVRKPEDIRNLIVNKTYISNQMVCPWVGIPTTSGTGSEVTPWATIWDKDNGLKYSIEGKNLFALGAIIGPCFTIGLPVKATVATGMDALCHATEAYWSRNTNAVSRVYALSAIENITAYLEKLIDEPTNEAYREKIALASFFAGMAFSNTKTTACHSISYPLTMMLGIDHGVAACLTLARVLQHNEDSLIEKEKLFRAFNISKSIELETSIRRILKKAGIPIRLRDYNADADIIEKIVENAYTKGRMDNNPVDIDHHKLKSIIAAIL